MVTIGSHWATAGPRAIDGDGPPRVVYHGGRKDAGVPVRLAPQIFTRVDQLYPWIQSVIARVPKSRNTNHHGVAKGVAVA